MIAPMSEAERSPEASGATAGSRWSFQVATLLGIPIRVHITFLALLVWFATMAAASLGLAANDEASPIWLGYPSPETVPEALLRDSALRQQVHALLDEANALAINLVKERRTDIHRVARQLLERDYLSGAEVEAILAVGEPTEPDRAQA